MHLDVADTRIVAATTATLTFNGRDADGEPADPGTVTVGVTRSDGSVVVAAGTATTVAGTDRTYQLTPAQTATVDRLTATWTVAGVVVGTTTHDVVGGVYVTTADIRTPGSALVSADKYPTPVLVAARTEVEYQFETSCNRAFVPRFHTETIESRGHRTLVLRYPELRSIAWATTWDGAAWVPVTVTVGNVPPNDAGLATLPDECWPTGTIRVGYVYGRSAPDPQLRKAAVDAIAYRIHQEKSAIDPRATQFMSADTGTLNLATPGMGIWVTAIPTVDAVLKDRRWTRVTVG